MNKENVEMFTDENVSELNEMFGKVLDKVCKEKGVYRKDIAESTGVSSVALSITLSKKSPSVISTKKLLEISTALGKHLVIGMLDDEQIEEFNQKLSGSSSNVRFCPKCGSEYEITPTEDNSDTSLATNFIICKKFNIDKEKKEEFKRTRMRTYEDADRKVGQKKK